MMSFHWWKIAALICLIFVLSYVFLGMADLPVQSSMMEEDVLLPVPSEITLQDTKYNATHPPPPPTLLTTQEQLQCAPAIKDYVLHSDSIHPLRKDLLVLSTEFALRTAAQQDYFYNSNIQKLYFKDATSLKNKMSNVSAKCNKYTSVAICSIQGGSGMYAQEWATHYHLLGVSKIYVYKNETAYGLTRALKPFADIGLVELIPWGVNKTDADAIQDCMLRTRERYEWLAYIEQDEYLSFNRTYSCLTNYLSDFNGAHDTSVASIEVTVRNLATNDGLQFKQEQEMFEIPKTSDKRQIAYLPGIKKFISPQEVDPKLGFSTYASNGAVPYVSSEGLEGEEEAVSSTALDGLYNNIELRHYWGISVDYVLYDTLCSNNGNLQPARLEKAFYSFNKDLVSTKVNMVTRQDDLFGKFLS